MPYIDPKERVFFDVHIQRLSTQIESVGQLNYVITHLIHRYIQYTGGLAYTLLNSMIGVIECVKQELYRIIIVPYENKKRIENGGVSELDDKTLDDVR